MARTVRNDLINKHFNIDRIVNTPLRGKEYGA